MRILAPLSNVGELKELIPLGVDEFYFGISLVKHLDETQSLNLRPHDFANLKSISQVKKAAKIIHNNNLRCFLALNTDYFRESLFKKSLELLEEINFYIDGVIITDLVLIEKVRKLFPKLKIIASTRCNILNSWSVKFYKDLGVDRFTLPRHLYLKDIIGILERFPEEEFEIFIKNEDCPYLNGMCSYIHNLNLTLTSDEGAFCRVIERYGEFSLVDKNKLKGNFSLEESLKRRYDFCRNYNCGLCWLDKLEKFKQRVILKITGRMLSLERKKRDLSFVKKSLEILEKKQPKSKILQLQREIYPEYCDNKCYFDL